jgi:hypothetical protein
MTIRTVLIACLVSLGIAPLAVPTSASAAAEPSFPKFFVGTLHSDGDSTTLWENVEYKSHSSLDVASAKFQRTKKSRWSKTAGSSLRDRPYADYKLTAGTATFVTTNTGAACPINFTTVYDVAASLAPRANILRLTYLKKGRWAVVARVRSTHGPFPMVQKCQGQPDTTIEIPAPAMILLTGDKISKSGKLLKGTVSESRDKSSTSSQSWNLAASSS